MIHGLCKTKITISIKGSTHISVTNDFSVQAPEFSKAKETTLSGKSPKKTKQLQKPKSCRQLS